MPVAGTDIKKIRQRARFEDLTRFAEGAVIPVIEADSEQYAGVSSGFSERREFSSASGTRSELIVGGTDANRVDFGASYGCLPISDC